LIKEKKRASVLLLTKRLPAKTGKMCATCCVRRDKKRENTPSADCEKLFAGEKKGDGAPCNRKRRSSRFSTGKGRGGKEGKKIYEPTDEKKGQPAQEGRRKIRPS